MSAHRSSARNCLWGAIVSLLFAMVLIVKAEDIDRDHAQSVATNGASTASTAGERMSEALLIVRYLIAGVQLVAVFMIIFEVFVFRKKYRPLLEAPQSAMQY